MAQRYIIYLLTNSMTGQKLNCKENFMPELWLRPRMPDSEGQNVILQSQNVKDRWCVRRYEAATRR